MKSVKPVVIAIILLLCFSVGSCVILPTISETHLMSDIDEHDLSISVGTEQPIGESNGILPDVMYEYVSYAPADWVEVGLAGHYSIALLGIDARFDIVDMFTDDSPISALILGGVLFFSGGSGPVGHMGAAVNYRINRVVEVYAGAATSTLFFAPTFYLGTNINIFKWLSLAANMKLALNTVVEEDPPPAALMISVAPRISFNLEQGDKRRE